MRFENEAQWVKSIGGIITRVSREGVKAANQDEHVQSALIEKYVDLHIMWPTYKPGDIAESHTLLKPVLKISAPTLSISGLYMKYKSQKIPQNRERQGSFIEGSKKYDEENSEKAAHKTRIYAQKKS